MESSLHNIFFYLYPSFVDVNKVLEAQKRGELPRLSDLRVAFLIAIGLTLIQYILTYGIFKPLAVYLLKIHDMKKPPKNSLIDEYNRTPRASKTDMEEIAKKKKVATSEVVEYFRAQRNYHSNLKQISKFNDALWRFSIYTAAVVVGLIATWNKVWLWDFRLCWVDYPFQQQPDNGPYWLYMFELGINFHLLFHHFSAIKRSDFLEMFIHHVATIGLILYSYLINFVRVGTVIMIIHDPSDIFLEGGKCVNYLKPQHRWAKPVCDAIFIVFAVFFFVLRLIIFPFVIKSTLIDAYYTFGPYLPWYIFNGLLFVLMFLHIFWFYLIIKMIFRAILSGEVEKDIRSDDELENDDNLEKTNVKGPSTKPKHE